LKRTGQAEKFVTEPEEGWRYEEGFGFDSSLLFLSLCHSGAQRRIPVSFLWPFLCVIQSRCGEESRECFFYGAALKTQRSGFFAPQTPL
jgi:hypothetical protein